MFGSNTEFFTYNLHSDKVIVSHHILNNLGMNIDSDPQSKKEETNIFSIIIVC